MEKEENIKAETSILTFEFDEKVYPGVEIKDSQDIKMIWDEKEKSALSGFQITINESTEQKIIDAKEQLLLVLQMFWGASQVMH